MAWRSISTSTNFFFTCRKTSSFTQKLVSTWVDQLICSEASGVEKRSLTCPRGAVGWRDEMPLWNLLLLEGRRRRTTHEAGYAWERENEAIYVHNLPNVPNINICWNGSCLKSKQTNGRKRKREREREREKVSEWRKKTHEGSGAYEQQHQEKSSCWGTRGQTGWAFVCFNYLEQTSKRSTTSSTMCLWQLWRWSPRKVISVARSVSI